MKTFLLVVYLFLPNGEAIIDRYPSAAKSIDECIQIGREKQKALLEEYKIDADTSMMCILEDADEKTPAAE